MLQSALYALLFAAAAIGLTLGAYLLMRRLVGVEHETHTKDLASSIIMRMSAFHALILALVFAQEMADYQQLRYESAVETNAIADVYFDADRYGGSSKAAIQDTLYAYVGSVIAEEWDHLGQTGRLLGGSWAAWDKAYTTVLDLSPQNGRETALRDHMLSQVHVIAESRVKRQSHIGTSLNGMFWLAAVSGVVVIALCYFVFPATASNLALLTLFGAYTGLILFFIYAFENPYSLPGRLEPSAHQHLLAQIEEARAR